MRILTFADGFTTNTTPTVTQTINIDDAIITTASIDTLEMQTLTASKLLRLNASGEVVSSSYDESEFTNKVNPNYVINGNFDFWQRGSGGSLEAYYADRFKENRSGSSILATRQTTTGAESFNAKYFHRTVATSVAGAGNYCLMEHRLEGVRHFSGKTMTLSFWAKADATKNMAIEFSQYFGSGGSPSATVNTIGVTTINLTTSWTKFTVTVAIPSISGKTIGTDLNDFTDIVFWFEAGSTFNSRTNSLGNQSGTFDIAQVKFENGSVATEFTLSGGSLAADLLNCKRFYQKTYLIESAPATDTESGMVRLIVYATASTTTSAATIQWQPDMRANPAVVTYPKDGAASDTIQFNSATSGVNEVAPNKTVDSRRMMVSTSGASGLTTGNGVSLNFHYTADAEL